MCTLNNIICIDVYRYIEFDNFSLPNRRIGTELCDIFQQMNILLVHLVLNFLYNLLIFKMCMLLQYVLSDLLCFIGLICLFF